MQRQYSKLINLSTGKSDFANRILELALNRTGKSFNATKETANEIEKDPVQMVHKISDMQDDINMMNNILMENADKESMAGKPKLSEKDMQRTKQMLQKDVAQYNNDLQLLSLLLGRPVKAEDIPKLTQNIPNGLGNPTTPVPKTTTSTTTRKPTTSIRKTTTVPPPFSPLSNDEIKILEAINKIQSTRVIITTTRKPVVIPALGRSQEAVLADLLKQRGIGPLNNQIPVDVS